MDTTKTNILEALSETLDSSTGVDHKKILQDSPTESVARFYCDALHDDSVNDIIGDAIPYLITLVGFSEFGKSTFVASLYHIFMACGEIDGYRFVDSDTFAGFERRAYVRNVQINTTKRYIHTASTEGNFLTLLLEKEGKLYKLIISDRAGETYRKTYSSNLNVVKKDIALINSPHIIFFLDSKAIFDDFEYMEFEDRFNLMLSRFKQADVFANGKKLDIIYNKYDLCKTENVEAFNKKSAVVEKRIESTSGLKLNKTFKVCSNRLFNNDDIIELFKYIVNVFDAPMSEGANECDWTSKYM